MTQEQIAPRVGVGWNGAKALPSVGAIRAGLINVLELTKSVPARCLPSCNGKRLR